MMTKNLDRVMGIRLTWHMVRGDLELSQKTHLRLAEQLLYMAGEARNSADSFLQAVGEQISALEAELNELDEQSSEESLERVSRKISEIDNRMRFSPLARRAIHQRNLHYLEKQVLHSEMILPQAELERMILPHVEREEEKVAQLESKESLTPHDREMLREHQHHLELYRQILAGERAYASLHLIHQMDHIEKEMATIDAEIANGWYKDKEAPFEWGGPAFLDWSDGCG
jgi:hypothetical protein